MSSGCDQAILMNVDLAYSRVVIPMTPFNNTIEVVDVTDVPEEIRDTLVHNFNKYHDYIIECQSKMLSYEDWVVTQNINTVPEDLEQFKISLSMLSIIR